MGSWAYRSSLHGPGNGSWGFFLPDGGWTLINGDLLSDSNSAAMMHSFPQIIVYVSQDETGHPGKFIGSGTVGGGCILEHGRILQPGDILDLEVEGLGRQHSRIVLQEAVQ